jgi:Carbohydrate binding domain
MTPFLPFGRSVCFLAALLSVAGLTSCGHRADQNDQPALIQCDFEQIDGWCPPNPSLTTDFAHSGRFSIKAGGDVEYSLTYARPLGLISPKRFRRVRFSAWAYLAETNAGAAQISVALHDPAQEYKQIFAAGFPLSEQVKVDRKWQQIQKEITLPENTEFAHELRIFIWKAGAPSAAYVDDIRVEVLE